MINIHTYFIYTYMVTETEDERKFKVMSTIIIIFHKNEAVVLYVTAIQCMLVSKRRGIKRMRCFKEK